MMRPLPPKAVTTPKRGSEHELPHNDARSAKRPRLAPSQDRLASQKVDLSPRRITPALPPPRLSQDRSSRNAKDEQALLDDLMAGLDASVFDYTPSSPVVSQKTPSQKPATGREMIGLENLGVREKRAKVEKEYLSPTKRQISPLRRKVLSPIKNIAYSRYMNVEAKETDHKPLMFRESAPMTLDMDDKSNVLEEKPEFDDELFEFDFDLTDIAGLDDEALINPPKSVSRCQSRCRL